MRLKSKEQGLLTSCMTACMTPVCSVPPHSPTCSSSNILRLPKSSLATCPTPSSLHMSTHAGTRELASAWASSVETDRVAMKPCNGLKAPLRRQKTSQACECEVRPPPPPRESLLVASERARGRVEAEECLEYLELGWRVFHRVSLLILICDIDGSALLGALPAPSQKDTNIYKQ